MIVALRAILSTFTGMSGVLLPLAQLSPIELSGPSNPYLFRPSLARSRSFVSCPGILSKLRDKLIVRE